MFVSFSDAKVLIIFGLCKQKPKYFTCKIQFFKFTDNVVLVGKSLPNRVKSPIYMKLYGRKILVFVDGELVVEAITNNLAAYADVVECSGGSACDKEYKTGRMKWSCTSRSFVCHISDLMELSGKAVDVIAGSSDSWAWEEMRERMISGRGVITSVKIDGATGAVGKAEIQITGDGNIGMSSVTGWFITADNYKLITSDGKRFVSRSQI